MQGKILKLFLTLDNQEKSRVSVNEIDADEHGILQDKFYAKDTQRSILISSLKSYQMAKDIGIELDAGSLGENILTDANLYHLMPGNRLTIGDVELEITQNCTICKGLSLVDKRLPSLLKNDRGIFAKVMSGIGKIKLEDSIVF